MSMMQISKSDNYKISKNFNIHEFFSKSYGVNSHNFDLRLAVAAQYIRTFFDKKVVITSSYRTMESNLAAGGASSSMHLKGQAIDFKLLKENNKVDFEATNQLHEYLINKNNNFYDELIKIGISGFGFYYNRTHLDTKDAAPRFWNKKKV